MTAARAVALGAVLFAAGLLAGCQNDRDRTVAKLKALKASEGGGAAFDDHGRPQPQGAALTSVLDHGPSDATDRPLPANLAPGNAGGLALQIEHATALQAVGNTRVKLTTPDRFLKLDLALKNAGQAPVAASVAELTLTAGKSSLGIASDVQQLAGSPVVASPLNAGEERKVTVFFELPASALGGPLTLTFFGPSGSRGSVTF